jgi:hypothetical protein
MKTLLLLFVVILVIVYIYFYIEKSVPTEYSYTRIVCSVRENNESYCQDAIITCKGNKVINVKLLGEPVKMNYTESPLGWCENE